MKLQNQTNQNFPLLLSQFDKLIWPSMHPAANEYLVDDQKLTIVLIMKDDKEQRALISFLFLLITVKKIQASNNLATTCSTCCHYENIYNPWKVRPQLITKS